jgi:hypothetical protein
VSVVCKSMGDAVEKLNELYQLMDGYGEYYGESD